MKIRLSIIVFSIILAIMCWVVNKQELEEEFPEVIYISTEEFSGLDVTQEVEVDEPIVELYDIPLNSEIQEYTITLAEEHKVPHELVFAIMEVESGFRTDIISGTNDFGIMQINKINHKWLSKELGITDFLDAKQNIKCGVYMISDLYHKYDGDLHKTLMAYNMGQTGARKHWNSGTRSSKYSRKVSASYDKYRDMETH